MSRAVLLSIQPKWVELIASGKKTIEVRKSRPKLEEPFKCYIYCTKSGRPLVYGDKPCADGWTEQYCQTYGYSREEAEKIWDVMNGRVVGEFVCDRVFKISISENGPFSEEHGSDYEEGYSALDYHDCLTDAEFDAYLKGKPGYGWHISELKIYDKPKELSEFTGLKETRFGYAPYELKRAAQSWCYVEEREP